jgi:hypothetical protein
MKIGPTDDARPLHPEDGGQRDRKTEAERTESPGRTDKVEISRSGRELLSESRKTDPRPAHGTNEVTSTEPNEEKAQVDAVDQKRREKIEQARQRMELDYYSSRDVKEKIARRIADDLIG